MSLDLTELSPEDEDAIFEAAAGDPVCFIEDMLGDEGWAGQYEIIRAIRDHRHVVCKSCFSIGKDWIAARAVLWFLYMNDPSLVITTGPSDRQVKKILWRELAKAHVRSDMHLGGTPLTQELTLDEDRYAIGFTTTEDAERFSGFHALNVLVVVDESSGVSDTIQDSISGILSSGNAHKLDIGNPTDPTSEFAAYFKTPGIKKISIDAFDTPNFTAFGITQDDIEADTWREKITGPLPMPMLITPEWVAERYRKWGKESPWYQSRVLAVFPAEGAHTLFPMRWIEAAQNRTLEPGKPDVLGVDVARYGEDKSIIARRQGPVVRILERFAKVDTMETTGNVRATRRETGASVSIVDVVGIGAGVVDRLVELHEPVQEASAGSLPIDRERFVDARAEWAWTFREALEAGEVDLDPADEDLAEQLSDMRFKHESSGKVRIESKDDMKKRGRASPDDADAVFHTFASESEFTQQYNKAMENL